MSESEYNPEKIAIVKTGWSHFVQPFYSTLDVILMFGGVKHIGNNKIAGFSCIAIGGFHYILGEIRRWK